MRKWLFLMAVLGIAALVFAAEPSTKADVAKGERLFEAHCSECHYPDSTDELVGPGLKGVKNGKLPSGREATRGTILSTIDSGVDEMPSFRERLKDSEKEYLITYVLTL